VGDPPPLTSAAEIGLAPLPVPRTQRAERNQNDMRRNNSVIDDHSEKEAIRSAALTPALNREEMIAAIPPLIRITATRLALRLPACMTLDDLTSAGAIGLIKARTTSVWMNSSRGLRRSRGPPGSRRQPLPAICCNSIKARISARSPATINAGAKIYFAKLAMTPERWRRIEDVYQAARDRLPTYRGAYLEETCGDDQDLRREIEFLLEQDNSSAQMILNRPAWLAFGQLEDTLVQPAPGTRLGPYEIECPLAVGGMGTVFRGRDTRLNRPVAIKLLRAQFSDRFEREARAISSLAHPHICTLYDIGADFLVMEFLEGETLASRLQKGPLPSDVARRYGAQIASAIAAAHAKGLVHRDLKPANIMLTRTGIKVLDFGLAKGAEDENLTLGIPGTPAYMSPEQREGKPCDYRTDIYALGLIMREMAAGKGGKVASTADTTQFAQLVDCCLREDPEARWQSASDLAQALEWLREQPTDRALPRKHASSFALWAVTAAVLIIGIFVLAAMVWRRTTHRTFAPSVVRLALPIASKGFPSDPAQLSGPAAISPDGKVVVLSIAANGRSSLWMRPLDSDRFEHLEGTDGAAQPFWSPDGAQIAFFAGGKVKKMRMPHGAPEILCETPTETARGGAWVRKASFSSA
jgi:hypothetical protein